MDKTLTRKKKRISTLAQCIRKTSMTAKLRRKNMPNAITFTSESIRPDQAAKFAALIEQIKVLDAKDIDAHGTMFKHFVFTDIRESPYGIKALTAYMIAGGFEFAMKKQPKTMMRKGQLVETKNGETVYVQGTAIEGGSKRFACLQSLPFWKNALSTTTKKAILGAYNARPDNVHGEHLRIIMLDSKFKEGIDLFDVKYVHLLEPPIATSDLKQAVGRATRFCGQRGLPFIPRRGWPLEVFTYRTELPNRSPFTYGTGQKVDAHDLVLKESGLDLALLELTKELTVLAITTAVDYDLNYKINNFDIEAGLLESPGFEDIDVVEVEDSQLGGKRVVEVHDVAEITPKRLAKCMKRKTKLFPYSRPMMTYVAKQLKMNVPKGAKRDWYCNQLKTHPEYLKALLDAPKVVPRVRPVIGSLDVMGDLSAPNVRKSPAASVNMEETLAQVRQLFATPKPVSAAVQKTLMKSAKSLSALYDLPFEKFQNGVRAMYAAYKWASPIVKSGCESRAVTPPGTAVSFTTTQDFVRHYLTPESPFKGLLAWHSVGTGKTCMAVAAATTYFEQAGYTILWVTRNALMADVYKNIFGSVCSIPIMDVLDKGYKLPSDLPTQKKLLSRMWLKPISYKMFQNALEKKNDLGRTLWANSPSDPLKKTFLIMDEIHKLRDGDLGPAETADFNAIQTFIHDSYKASGDESVRPLLMTATPITDTPVELFDILNTLIPESSRRLMPFDKFRTNYADESGRLTPAGRDYFQDKAKGLISYLNREYDPTTFAQPKFHIVRVALRDMPVPTLVDLVDTYAPVAAAKNVPLDCDAIQGAWDTEVGKLETSFDGSAKELKAARKDLDKTYKAQLRKCLSATRKAGKETKKKAKKWFTSVRRTFKRERQDTQLGALERCYGKAGVEYPEFDDFYAELERRGSEGRNYNSVGAVKTPIV